MMYRFFIILLIVGVIMKACPSWAQLDPNKLTHFPELEGNMVHDIITDQQGVLWIATQSGLMTFDGIEYKRFHPIAEDTTTIGTILTTQLHMDDSGNIWIGCMYDLYKYNPKTRSFKKYVHKHLSDYDESRQPVITSITSDQKGRIYFGIGSFNGGSSTNTLIYYDEVKDSLVSFPLKEGVFLDGIYQVESDYQGNIWIISNSGFFKINQESEISPVPFLNDLVSPDNYFLNGFASAQDGKLWATSNDAELFVFDTESGEMKNWSMRHIFDPGEFLNYTLELVIDSKQNIWMPSHHGLIYFDVDKEQFHTFPEARTDRLQGSFISCLHQDSFDNLWIGVQTVGLLKYSDKKLMQSVVHNLNDEEGLIYGWVLKFMQQSDGTTWVNTMGGIHTFYPESGELIPVPGWALSTDPPIWRVGLITETIPGQLLLNTNQGNGIYDTDHNSFRFLEKAFIPDSLEIITARKDQDNNIWIGTNNGIYVVDKLLNIKKHFNMMDFGGTSIASNLIANFVQGKEGGMWISTNDGLFLYDATSDSLERHVHDPSKGDVIDVQDINSLYLGADGVVWIGTWLGGLCKYHPETGKVKTYSLTDGLPSMSIQGILGDEENNNLWISTFAGLSRFDIESEKFNNYSLDDGIQGLLHTDGSYFNSSEGYFYFGGNNGFTYFRPEDMISQSTPPRVYLTEIMAGSEFIDFSSDKEGDLAESITLSHSQNSLSFRYIGIQYDNPEKNSYRFMLENYDDTWRDVGNLRSAFYYNLPPGKYTFRVIAANSNDVWNEKGASVSFVISPPWWMTWWAYILYGLIFIMGVFTLNRILRKRILEKQQKAAREKELAQAREIEKAYTKLKNTQSQLLHAEKMASLGELTAGIAHEIQNPLNFVNNFSEVNSELMEELTEEINKGNIDEVLTIVSDMQGNEEKIIHHGKRADAIVKNMLQHSRGGGDEKIPTDINALADEYLRLSYHGLRAKDKSFNADFKAELDPNLPKVKVVPQDIGRVLLNIINNAFYAVSAEASAKVDPNFKPMVTVSTLSDNGKVEIKVTDNGTGIPESIREKIFQPFFTTKSTGEGTGLGLSLSYDIITKGHGGSLDVHSKPGSGTEMIIRLNK